MIYAGKTLKHTSSKTLKQLCYISRRTCLISLLSAIVRTRRWSLSSYMICKTGQVRSEKHFLLRQISIILWQQGSGFGVKALFCILSTVQAVSSAVRVWWCWKSFLATHWASIVVLDGCGLNVSVYLHLVAEQPHSFMAITGLFQPVSHFI